MSTQNFVARGLRSPNQPKFDEADWTKRLAVALEDVASTASPSYSPLPPELPHYGPIDEYESIFNRGYRSLAARAKHDPIALSQFKKSSLEIKTDPAEARAILREHPLMKPGLVGSGKNEAVQFRVLNGGFSAGLNGLVAHLAKLSVKEGSTDAARRLHRHLTAGAKASIPAHEITVFHGVVVKERFDLGAGAYLAPYEYARLEFDLPDEPEPWPREMSFPNAAVLVRGLEYGPGVAPVDHGPGLPDLEITYRFPAEYTIDLERWFDDSKLLVDLLSIAARVPLLSRTCHVRLAKWIEEIDPNFGFGTQVSGGPVSDVWPKGCDLAEGDADVFVALARGWLNHRGRRKVNLAIRRLGASFSRPGGQFGIEDRVLDTAIALEIMYGLDGPGLTNKLSTRAAWLLGGSAEERRQIFDEVKSFYQARSAIVHGAGKNDPDPDKVEKTLENGRNVACRTFSELLRREPLKETDWKKLVFGGEIPRPDAPS